MEVERGMARFGGFVPTEYFLHRTVEPDHQAGLRLLASSNPKPRSANRAVGRSSRTAPMPLQLPQATSCAEVWTRSQNSRDASWPDQKQADFPRYLYVPPELFVLGKNRLGIQLSCESARSDRLADFYGCLTTLDSGNTTY